MSNLKKAYSINRQDVGIMMYHAIHCNVYDCWLYLLTQCYCDRVALWLEHDSRAPMQVRQGSATRDTEVEPLHKTAEEQEELDPGQRFTHTHSGPCPKGKVTGWSFPLTRAI